MAKEPNIYRRLPGRGTAALQSTALYLASDHLLQVASSGFSENYKRFYYRDIQTIAIHRTSIGKLWNALWCTLAGFLALGGLAVDGVARLVLLVLAGVFGLAALANIIIGPSCACVIGTAVQSETLPSLKRLRKTEKILARLRPLITAAQGQLSSDELAMRLEQARRRPSFDAGARPLIYEEATAPPIVSTESDPSREI